MITNIDHIYKIYKKYKNIFIDTRKINSSGIFFALKTISDDGHNYIYEAFKLGVNYVVIDNIKFNDINNSKILLVDNVLFTLQRLANYHRQKLNIFVIAITGSNGKTTTKSLLFHILSSKFSVFSLNNNYNNNIGVPLSILSIPYGTDICILEFGISNVGDMEELCKISLPDFGYITSFGISHLNGLYNLKNIILCKKKLYDFIEKKGGVIFINNNDKIQNKLSCKYKNKFIINKNLFSILNDCEYKFSPISVIFDNKYIINTNLYGKYNYNNICSCIGMSLFFNIDINKIKYLCSIYHPLNNRMNVTFNKNITFIDDTYNANPTSMLSAIKYIKNINTKRTMLVIGDMLDLGIHSNTEHIKIFKYLVINNFKYIILIGSEFMKIRHEYNNIFNFKKVSNDIILFIKLKLKYIKYIFLKASREIRLDKIVVNLIK